MTNPRLLHLLAQYAKFDQLTLILAAVALAFVLLAWVSGRIPLKIFGFQLSAFSYSLLVFFWILVLAGTTYILYKPL